ncbi:hypothetical protein LX88_005368 [Lentzea californiensis]|nr:hypothetical protein [Lentzea californiensis]
MIVAFGLGGGGKTSLLEHVRRRRATALLPARRVRPHAVAALRPRPVRAVRRTGRRSPPPRPRTRGQADDPARRGRGRRRGAAAQGLGKVLLLWLIGLAVVAPRPLRWLLGDPRVASALRWFENYAGRPKFDAALVHTWNLNRAGEDLEIDRLPVAAFLADITADRLLSLLAERRAEEPHVSLLVIAIKQSTPSAPNSPVSKSVRLERFTWRRPPLLAEWNRTRNSTVESRGARGGAVGGYARPPARGAARHPART